jgi:hypothetical protein
MSKTNKEKTPQQLKRIEVVNSLTSRGIRKEMRLKMKTCNQDLRTHLCQTCKTPKEQRKYYQLCPCNHCCADLRNFSWVKCIWCGDIIYKPLSQISTLTTE